MLFRSQLASDLIHRTSKLAGVFFVASRAKRLAGDLIHRTSKLAGVSKTVTASHFRAPCRSLLRVAWRDASSDDLKALPALPTESKSATNARSLTQKTRIRYRLANLVPNSIELVSAGARICKLKVRTCHKTASARRSSASSTDVYVHRTC